MKYIDFKVSIFALICLKDVTNGQKGTITSGSGYFNSTSSVLDLRLNITPAFNRTYSNCISTLKTIKQNSHEMNVICDECTKPCLPLSNTESSCSRWSALSNCSGTCGNGTQTRVKVCTGPNGTVKDEFETIKCNVTAECQESRCSRWSALSNCSGTCGNGTQTRVKVCTGPNGTVKDEFETIKCNVTAECQESRCSRWSALSNCSGTCGNGTQTRVKVCTGPNGTVKDEFETIKCNVTAECQESRCSRWSALSNCSGTCGNGTQTRVKVCTGPNGTVKDEFETIKCNVSAECQESSCSRWSALSNCSGTCGNGTQTRVKVCTGPNGTVKDEFETIKCNVTAEFQEKSTQTNRQQDVTDDAQNFTSAHIAIVAIACFLIGILVAALASIVYMKRKHQGCFFHNNKSVEVGSRMQSGPDLQSLTTRALANEYESMDNKNENKTVETSYDSLDLDKISKDQQTYDHLEQEPPFEQCENKPHSSYQKLTLRNGISANTTPSKIENVSEYERDSQDNENVSRQCKPNSQETHTVVEDMVREVRGENGNSDHVYSVLEPADSTRKMLDRQSDADHNYLILETVDKVAEVGSG